MAFFDLPGALTTFDDFSASSIDHNAQVTSSPAYYAWKTTSNFIVTALRPFNNITATGAGPTGGTISTVNVVDSGSNPIFSITGLNAPLLSLVTPGNPSISQEHFWETVLAAATPSVLPQHPAIPAPASA